MASTREKLEAIKVLLFPPISNDGSVLYHYTDFNGLKGILESGQIRATCSKVLNDGTERSYAAEIVIQHLESISSGELHPIILSRLKTPRIFLGDTFVSCFCEDADLLSMWRGYAGYGGGFCIGFYKGGLQKLAGQHGSLVRMHYGSTLSPELRIVLEQLHELLLKIPPQSSQDDIQVLSLAVATFDLIKHSAFREEKEWRIIRRHVAIAHREFMSAPANIKYHVNLSMPKEDPHGTALLPIATVVCGPTLRKEETTDALQDMLIRYGYFDIKVSPSEAPYRL